MTLPVLLYHSVAETADPRFAQWTVTPGEFAAQMGLIGRAGYRSVTIRELSDLLWDAAGGLERVVAITFDDGFADFHSSAWPHLRRNGLTATVFVTTAYIGATSAWLHAVGEGERPMMSRDQLAEIAGAGIEVGAHGHRHVQLDTVSRTRAAEEIERSRDVLRDVVGPVSSFAYPHGYHTGAVRRAVRRAGFESACAVRDGLASTSDDRYAITRAVIRRGTTLETFASILDGRRPTPRRRPLRRAAWRAARQAGWEPQLGRLGDWAASRPPG